MKKRNIAFVVAFLVFGVAAAGLIAVVYAKYTSKVEKSGTATIAKWAFTTDNTTGSVVCQLDQTYNSNTLVANKIAPGTSGYCPISISNASSEVGISYDITPNLTGATNKPTNLKFYSDAAHQNEITDSAPLHGNLNPGAAATTVDIYWEWKYQDQGATDAYNVDDTTDGTRAASSGGAEMSVPFDIVGTQLEPTAQ